jgi:hypothetical protein
MDVLALLPRCHRGAGRCLQPISLLVGLVGEMPGGAEGGIGTRYPKSVACSTPYLRPVQNCAIRSQPSASFSMLVA